jgi:2-polyprenyl-6-methoxyphenol hydroxylase-like FAD-dependent oxidoreductase
MVNLPIIIIGAGISGLLFAQGLRKHSYPFLLFESDTSLTARMQGYRFRISDEGMEALGQNLPPELFEKLQRACAFVPEGSTNTPPTQLNGVTGEAAAPLYGGKPGPGACKRTPLSVDRLVLRKMLMVGIEEYVHFGKGFESFEVRGGGGVKVKLSDGTTVEGRFLVGADGAWSKVRGRVLPEYRLLDTEGRLIYGKVPLTKGLEGMIDGRLLNPALTFTCQPSAGLFLVTEPMRFERKEPGVPDDYVYWAMYVPKDKLPGNGTRSLKPGEALTAVREFAKDWYAGFQPLFDGAFGPQADLVRIVAAHPNIATWDSELPVTLIGDSVHAMPTTAALGATTAVRDSACFLAAMEKHRSGGDVDWKRARGDYEGSMREYAANALWKGLYGGKAMFKMKEFDCLVAV